MEKKPEIIFTPGCFDNFEGTQEELDELVNEIKRLVETGELFEQATPVEELDEEDQQFIENLINNSDNRNVQ